ncbi:Carbohydrate binding module family 20 [Dillenia turbinata]|uniref:Carbohydrate binding module family 20 n=1 Tax=Dillenia turbinata TaxID=194707 RepID=A0AAN8W598_9MAGN
METLTNSSSKIFTEKQSDRGFPTARDVLIRPQICFLRKSHRPINSGFHNLIIYSQRKNPIRRPFFSSSLSEVALEDEKTATLEEPCQLKTANVKFQLRKKCMFGEQFLVVGDDPVLGLWDPEGAIPLEWSDGHLWTLELDIPTEKSIQYKFILKGVTGKILWQPGPDRVLQTWETNNTICVTEDWENAGLQKIVEEEPVLNHSEKSSITQQSTSVVAEIIHAEEPKPLKETNAEIVAMVAENITQAEESNSKTFYSKPLSDTKKEANSNNNVTTRANIAESKGRAATLNSPNAKVNDNMITYEGAPVLVPGLTPLTTGPTEASTDKDDKTTTTVDAAVENDEAKDQNEPQLNQNQNVKKQEPDGHPHVEATHKVVINGERQENVNKVEQMVSPVMEQDLPNSEIETSKVLQNDIQWGQKALQKLLSSFGFLLPH